MKKTEIYGKKVLVIGMGISGVAAIELLARQGAVVSCYDDKETAEIPEELNEVVCEKFFGTAVPDFSIYDLAVIAPGVPLNIDPVKRLMENNIEIIGEVELAYRNAEGVFIGITGTNGKTTTTTWLHKVFARQCKNAYLAGNVGIPLCKMVLEHDGEDTIYVTELSSYQLETASTFECKAAAFLNLTPDHISRHGNIENYAACKYKIAQNMGDLSNFVLNLDDKNLRNYISEHPEVKTFSLYDNNADIFLKNGSIYAKKASFDALSDYEDTKIIERDEIFLKGDHNVMNAMAVIAVSLISGIEMENLRAELKDFKGVPHRLEFVSNIGGIDFYNDSKATNPEASIPAIRAMRGPYVLIAGGMDKGSDYSEWIGMLGYMKRMIIFGETKDDIAKAMLKSGRDDFDIVDNLEDAFYKAVSYSVSGDTVLLSPACASWDMYKSFEHRGDHFKRLVAEFGER